MWQATLVPQQKEYPCTILDVSEMGARIDARDVELCPSLVTIRCERFGALNGWLLWSRGGKAGIRIEQSADEVFQLFNEVDPRLGRKHLSDAPTVPRVHRQHFRRLPPTYATTVEEPVISTPEPEKSKSIAPTDLP